jgi:hypothetical protein
LLVCLLPLAACVSRQEGEELRDVPPESRINTKLDFPKNPQRWAFVASRVSSDPQDPFAGYRVVLTNLFAAQKREEGQRINRGAKFAQFVYEPETGPSVITPGALRRVNLMVQDPERYAETGGWGYASFDAAGRPIPIVPRGDCLTCHTSGPISRLPFPER